jgi:RNA polymerase sigma factor (TIGR02999 family)
MRRILIERARQKSSVKAGGGRRRVPLSGVDPTIDSSATDLIALSQAIDKLAAKDPRKAELVKLRFFAGLTNEQAAQTLGLSTRTAYKDWAYAKAYLRVEMSDPSDTDR